MRNLIFRGLRYQEIDHRYERIALAYPKTFDWIFDERSTTGFNVWMRDADPSLYWITGKPGSGNSTLMKFIFDHPRTRQELAITFADKPVITASAYIWNSGTHLQMSFEGVVQSLLYQILRARPALVPIIFSHWFEAGALLGNWIGRADEMVWVWEELTKALRSVLLEAGKTDMVVLFIDGLDEFAGQPPYIIEFVTSLISSGVKVCASSRPWVAFEDALGRLPHLLMQDLTQGDIKHYVTSQLKANEGYKVMEEVHPRFCASLVEDVCARSSGVFLWVVLVTYSLLEGLTDGENVVELQRRFNCLPGDLEKLFWRILKGLDKRNFSRACQLLTIRRHSESTLTILDLSFADDLDGDADFALNAPLELWVEPKRRARGDLMHRRMTASCKGLLEANAPGTKPTWRDDVIYLHRTVKDFVEQPTVWSQISSAVGSDFDHCARLFNVHLMRLKVLSFTNSTLKDVWENFLLAISYASQVESDGSWRHMQMLNELDRAMEKVMKDRLTTDITTYMAGPRWADISEWRGINQDEPSLLELAVRFQFPNYVALCLDSVSKSQAVFEASKLLHKAVSRDNTLKINQADVPKDLFHKSLSQETIQVLLQYADPNRVSQDGTSPWSKLLKRTTLNDEMDIAKDFLNAGADPKHPYLDEPEIKSRISEDFKQLLKQKVKATSWRRHFGSSSIHGHA